MNSKIYDVAVLGAGASGLFFGSMIKDRSICIIDANKDIGAKIKISGGGRCNITNKRVSENNYLGDKEFIKKTFDTFSNTDFLSYLKQNNLQLSLEDKIVKGQYFFKKSTVLIEFLKKQINHAKLFLNTKVEDVDFNEYYSIKTSNGIIKAKKLIIASGGESYRSIGASTIGFDMAKKFGHTINRTSPALVGFTVQKDQFWFKELSGLSQRVAITIDGKRFYQDMLFAHKGCSGPVVLNASLYWQKGNMQIDFLPDFDLNKLSGNSLISSRIPAPKRFVKAFLQSIDLDDKPISKLSSEEKKKLQSIKAYTFSPAGTFGYTKAEVTKGGVSTDEIDQNTFLSLKQKDLYFIGEVLDVTGELGGYNFQWAFSSAYKCAKGFD